MREKREEGEEEKGARRGRERNEAYRDAEKRRKYEHDEDIPPPRPRRLVPERADDAHADCGNVNPVCDVDHVTSVAAERVFRRIGSRGGAEEVEGEVEGGEAEEGEDELSGRISQFFASR